MRNSLLARYFGKAFLQKHDTVALGNYQITAVMHGPGGKTLVSQYFIDLLQICKLFSSTLCYQMNFNVQYDSFSESIEQSWPYFA